MSSSAKSRDFRALLFAAWLVGCHPGSPRLEGHWRGVRVEGVSGEALASANAFAARTELDVSADKMTIATPGETQSGRYRVVREDESSVTLTTDKDGPDAPQTFTFENASTLKWTAVAGKSIVFARSPR